MVVWASFLIFYSRRKDWRIVNASRLNYFSLAVVIKRKAYYNWGGCQTGKEIAIADEER